MPHNVRNKTHPAKRHKPEFCMACIRFGDCANPEFDDDKEDETEGIKMKKASDESEEESEEPVEPFPYSYVIYKCPYTGVVEKLYCQVGQQWP